MRATLQDGPLPLTLPCTLTTALQEKVVEVETRLREQLSDTKRRLNEARREQAKAGEMCWEDLALQEASSIET